MSYMQQKKTKKKNKNKKELLSKNQRHWVPNFQRTAKPLFPALRQNVAESLMNHKISH